MVRVNFAKMGGPIVWHDEEIAKLALGDLFSTRCNAFVGAIDVVDMSGNRIEGVVTAAPVNKPHPYVVAMREGVLVQADIATKVSVDVYKLIIGKGRT